jgi:hypothetical protein
MAEPSKVTSDTFKVIEIIYNDTEFSVALGIWKNDTKHIAMRWNGTGEEIGFPQTFGRSTWLLIPQDLSVIFTKSLLELNNVDKRIIYQALSELH